MIDRPHIGRPDRDLEESTLGLRSSIGFDDEVNNLGIDMAKFQTLSHEDFDFNIMNEVYDEGGEFEQGLFEDRPSSMAGFNPFAPNARVLNNGQTSTSRKGRIQGSSESEAPSNLPERPSAQNDIVNRRGGRARQQFGQITPPNDDLPEAFHQPQKQPQVRQHRVQASDKLSNEQRARNAANTRHSRTKGAKQKGDQNDINSDGEGGQKQSQNITLQREKNRVAAAKCRAKKKSANEQQEGLANEYGSTNNYLTREIRELKNQKTELQNFLLAHRPGVCECHGIHDYNFGQAQRLVLNARRHAVGPANSPSIQSALSAQSPISESSAAGIFAPEDARSPQERTTVSPTYPSFNGPANYAFPQDMHPEFMQADLSTGRGGQHISHEFAEFLQSSPGGRAGFS